jgi:hypothetical protein
MPPSFQRGSLRMLTRRAVCVALGFAGLSLMTMPRSASAGDPLRDLAASPDFHVRANAAATVGRTQPAGAREALEVALGDKHPAVRLAAANALAELGVRYFVRLGNMRNSTAVRGDEMQGVLHSATRSRARALKGAAVLRDADSALLAKASGRKLPVITLEGSITQLAESPAAGGVQVQARVEFLVRREHLLKGTLAGGATTFGTSPTLSDQGRRRLQDDAVDGAVQSALRGADQGLLVAGL